MRLQELFEKVTVTVNRELNPKLWRGGELDPEVKQHLLKIAEHFETFVGIDLPVKDLTITGSNANYTWTAHSDLDLHLIVPGTPTEEQRELYTAKKALWSEQHDIMIRGMEVECYVQGEAEPHHSTGVYSLTNDQWVIEPKKVKPQVDDNAVDAKEQDLTALIVMALENSQLDQLTRVKDKITKMRKSGLERAGEWSTENLVFKSLRNQGLIDRLATRIRELEDQQLSLENAKLS
jgi:hypothetical protein